MERLRDQIPAAIAVLILAALLYWCSQAEQRRNIVRDRHGRPICKMVTENYCVPLDPAGNEQPGYGPEK